MLHTLITPLQEFEKDKLDDALLKKIGKFTAVSWQVAMLVAGSSRCTCQALSPV
jgi:hypothetical protein